jgi:DNA-binding NtrC family response regulator
VLIVHEDSRTGGIGESLAAIIQEEAFESLDAPSGSSARSTRPVPYSPPLETCSCRGRRDRARRADAGGTAATPAALVGDSEAAARARDALAHAAARRHPALIVAEPGCRPLEVARALHRASRPGQPFVAVPSGPDAADLAQRIFGTPTAAAYETDLEVLGADAALLIAAGGTLFIEDVDDLPASAQRKLSRVLRDGEVAAGGAAQPVALACRLVAATVGDPRTDAHDGRFRDDLLRRFQQCVILVPPIRQRSSDLPAIVERLVRQSGLPERTFTQPALTVLAALPWPRNIDELAATLTAVLTSAGSVVRQEDVLARLPIENAFTRVDTTASLREARRRFEREYIAAVLERHHWKMSEAARTLGIERANLYRKARQLGIRRASRPEAT